MAVTGGGGEKIKNEKPTYAEIRKELETQY